MDSCGWLECFTDGALADEYRPYLEDCDNMLVPSIVLYEVYKFLKRGRLGREHQPDCFPVWESFRPGESSEAREGHL